ncbi:substrate-binding periplasmic protein [Bdellovibrio svalbardensis]|uniref:Transporter substrate-binding domain-containing protein n=1 Tax=Bdellovibrio svalbardensis TaxID=2972972 RepID=A0ABT6DLR2_9BACT|nr:transporter substrate-binding domain-containing protein [Bdellovibrio svalbardensis]MDG0817822.1 transporter substrate-binding domain-containing protein [Bdellovibrio svalbardensis]
MRTILFVSFLFFSQLAFAKIKVRITTGEWPPYISNSLDNKGLLAQITTEAFAQKDVAVQLGFFPWARTNELSKSGEWDGTIAYARLKEREKYYLFSDPIYVGRYVLFYLKTHPFNWTQYSDLKNIPMASTRGFGGMGDRFIQAEKDGLIKVERLTSDIQSFNMLRTGRVQAVPSDLEVGYVLLQKIYGKDVQLFAHHPLAIQVSEYHLVISKKVKDPQNLIDTFNDGLKKLRHSGRYNEIIRSWYAKPIYQNAVPSHYLTVPK